MKCVKQLEHYPGFSGVLHLFQNIVRLGGPDERLGVLVVPVNVALNRDALVGVK